MLPEGDRALPQAGLIFFEYRGKTERIQSLELIYTGPASKATLTVQPQQSFPRSKQFFTIARD